MVLLYIQGQTTGMQQANDVISLGRICKDRDVEFNIEGNPFSEPAEPFQGLCKFGRYMSARPSNSSSRPAKSDNLRSWMGKWRS